MAERATEWLRVVSALCGEITGFTAWVCFTYLFYSTALHPERPEHAGARPLGLSDVCMMRADRFQVLYRYFPPM